MRSGLWMLWWSCHFSWCLQSHHIGSWRTVWGPIPVANFCANCAALCTNFDHPRAIVSKHAATQLGPQIGACAQWNLGVQGFEAFMSIWRHCGGMMWNDLTLMIVDCWNQGEKSLNQIRPFLLMVGVVKVSVAKVPWYGTSCYFMATLWKIWRQSFATEDVYIVHDNGKQGKLQTDGHGMWWMMMDVWFSGFRLFSSFCFWVFPLCFWNNSRPSESGAQVREAAITQQVS